MQTLDSSLADPGSARRFATLSQTIAGHKRTSAGRPGTRQSGLTIIRKTCRRQASCHRREEVAAAPGGPELLGLHWSSLKSEGPQQGEEEEPTMATVSARYIVDDVDAAMAFYTHYLGFSRSTARSPGRRRSAHERGRFTSEGPSRRSPLQRRPWRRENTLSGLSCCWRSRACSTRLGLPRGSTPCGPTATFPTARRWT